MVSWCLHYIAVAFKVVFISTQPAFFLLPAHSSELWSLYKNVECKDWWDNCCRNAAPPSKMLGTTAVCVELRVQQQA